MQQIILIVCFAWLVYLVPPGAETWVDIATARGKGWRVCKKVTNRLARGGPPHLTFQTCDGRKIKLFPGNAPVVIEEILEEE